MNAVRRFFHSRSLRRGGEHGFTLVEMLVVITIIGLIMALVGPRVLNYLSESKVKTARIQIESFSSALDLFYLDNGRYPSSSEGLPALVQRPANSLVMERAISQDCISATGSLGPTLSVSGAGGPCAL